MNASPFVGDRIFLALITLFAAVIPATVIVGGERAAKTAGVRRSGANIICEVRPYNGKPTVFVNGQPRFPMAYVSYYPQPFRYQKAGSHGIHFYNVAWTLTDKWLGGDLPVKWNVPGLWKGPDTIDGAAIERSLGEIVGADPQALIFPRIYCDSPAWWDKLHPHDGNGDGPLGGQALRQSFSSQAWRNDTAAALRKIVRFVSSSKYGGHVIGYMPTAGSTEELAKPCDESPCAQRRFREWLWERYGRDEKTVERLFGAKLGDISIPSAGRRSIAGYGNFLDPGKSRLVIDLRRFQSDELVDSALAFCKAVKEESGRRLVTGFYYGYTRYWPDTGHLALRRVLESKDVDFLTTAIGWSATETDSVLRAGKLFYSEIDTRTSLSQWISKIRPDIDPQGVYNEQRWFGPPTIPESLQELKRVFAKNLVCGWANWWFDLWGGWYDDEAFWRVFGQMQAVGEETIRQRRGSVAQIAVVLDEEAYRYLPYGVAERGGKCAWIFAQLHGVESIGAPYDLYLFDDLKDLDLSRYRMLVLLNPFVLSEEQRQMVRTRCMAHGRSLVWMYAPGLIKDDLSVDNVSSLLGMKFQIAWRHPKTQIAVKMSEGKMTCEADEVMPFLYVAGGADREYGHTPDGRVVVAEKRGADFRNLFVSMPPLPREALRQYAKQAGVHLYAGAGATVFANESYLAITASGKQMIRLPKKAALKELLALRKGQSSISQGESFAANTAFEMDFSEYPCRIFQVLHQGQ